MVPARIPATPWKLRYGLGVFVAVAAVVSQYFVPDLVPALYPVYHNLAADMFLVYGVPILAFVLLVGLDPLRGWRRQMRVATFEGLGWYGGLSLLALGVAIGIAILYAIFDPKALELLSRPNPALSSAEHNPWLYVGLSFLVGVSEEVIFRGWIFGTWWRRTGSWFVPALGSSAIFAGVHLYYGITYGPAAPFFYVPLFLLGFAFAATYRAANGNLVVPVVLHGVNDAIAFLTIVSGTVALAAHYGLIVGASAVGLAYLLWKYTSTGAAPPAS